MTNAKEVLQLNNLKTFKEEGFKIKRDEEVITLNSDEMDLFKFFYMIFFYEFTKV